MFRKGLIHIISLVLIISIGVFSLASAIGTDSKVALAEGDAEDPDLLIITPQEFSAALEPLVEHKNATGMPTRIITLEDIYATFDGVDEPERIKKAIEYYYAIDDIKYVMLVGDCNKFPVRWQFGHLVDHLIEDDDPNNDDKVYGATDFYYADLYDEYGAFNDWDADGDGYYGEIYRTSLHSDGIDPIPEVAVARVPAADLTQLQTYVEKIIAYELTSFDAQWFKKLLLIQQHWGEDVYAKENIASDLEPLGFQTTRLYTSINGTMYYSGPIDGIPDSYSISRELNKGVGFVSELYHGHPTDWDYLYNVDNVANDLHNYSCFPVIYSGACETAKFYGATIPYRNYLDVDGFPHPAQAVGSVGSTVSARPAPIQPNDNVLAIGEAFLMSSKNGAIAYFGSTETGEPAFHNVLDQSFFEAYSLGYHILGDMWTHAVDHFADYFGLRTLTADNTWVPICKVHTPSRFLLLGDPSLRVGGINRLTQPPGSDWGVLFSENAMGRDIINMSYGYAVAGYGWDPSEENFDQWSLLAKYDFDGNLIYWADYDLDKADVAYSLLYDAALERYVVTGGKYEHYGGEEEPEYEHYSVWLMSADVNLDKQWDTVFGDPFPDWGNSIVQDGDGYLIGGWNGISTLPNQGYSHVIRTENDGSLDWELGINTGGETLWLGMAEVYSIEKTTDGGCILGTSGGMVKFHLDSPMPTSESLEWLGGSGEYRAAKQTADGGYIGVGRVEVDGPGGENPYDMVITKLDNTGSVTWNRTYGRYAPVVGATGMSDVGYDVIEADGGYVVTGYTESYGYHGGADLLVAKYDTSGVMEWDLALGDSSSEEGRAIVAAPGGGYVITGRASWEGANRIWTVKVTGDYTEPVASFTYSPSSPLFIEDTVIFDGSASYDPDGELLSYFWDFGDGTTGPGITPQHRYKAAGNYVATLFVIDDDGLMAEYSLPVIAKNMEMQWEKFYGDGRDWGYDICFTSDGGFVIAGVNTLTTYGDLWVFKTDSRGNEVWNQRYAGPGGRIDAARAVTVAQEDDGYIVAGFREKTSSDREIWIMKVADADGSKVWEKFYNYGTGSDEAYDIRRDGSGYIITGLATADDPARFYDILLLKIDANGDEEWHEMYPDPGGIHTCGYSVARTADEGYVITGGYADNNNSDGPFLAVKVKADHTEDWRRNTSGATTKSTGFWIDQTAELGYIAAGTLGGDFALVKYFPSGYVDWTEQWDMGYNYDYGRAAASFVDGGYIIVGNILQVMDVSYWDDLYIVRTDAAGNLLWDWKSDTADPDEGANAVLTYSNGACVVLGTRSPGAGGTWIFKIGPNTAPVAVFDYTPVNPLIGDPAHLDASASSDDEGPISEYLWDFGNGDTATGVAVDYTFPSTGTYNVTLTVVDGDGGEDSVTHAILVVEEIVVDFTANVTSGPAPLSVGFTSEVTGGTAPFAYAWDMDNDTVVDSTEAGPTWLYTDPGAYTVSLEVTDSISTTDTETKADYIKVTGITTDDPDVTITTAEVSDDPAADPETYDPTGAPAGIEWETALGFVLGATGPDDIYTFQIHFSSPVTPDFVLYKLPGWTETTYAIIDDYTIEVTLGISLGILDPPFVLSMVNVPCTPGDANEDGNIDAGDLVAVLRIILELDTPTCGADANQDSNINILDLVAIDRIILGLD
jgi:PKD repeat protein